jgi:hypothetical protein
VRAKIFYKTSLAIDIRFTHIPQHGAMQRKSSAANKEPHMNRIVRISLATGLLSAAALAATAANAQVFGSISINLPGPPVAVLPAPPVYVRPAPPARVYAPAYGHYQPNYGHYHQDRGYDRGYRAARWDRDGDGVPNRYDRRPMDPYRR